MGALLYSEWSVVRASVRQYVAVTAIMSLVIGLGATSLDAENAVETAAHVHMAVVPTITIMLTFFVFFSLFGADEREGWETARLALPVSRRQVVAARYLVMFVALAISAIVANVTGIAAGAFFSWAHYGMCAFQPLSDALSFAVAIVAVFVVYVAIEMPIFFKWGLAKARPYFNIPALVVALLMFPLLPLLESANISLDSMSLSQGAGEIVAQLGSAGVPWPVVIASSAVGLALALGAYLISMRIAQRIYAKRDF